MEYVIRTMKQEDMNIAVKWAAEEGWNPGLNDAENFYRPYPQDFFIGELDGEHISCKSAVRYKNNFGFMGFYIVKKQLRGKGYGLKIWKHGFHHLEGMTSGMDGVVEQQPNYKKSGYILAYRQIRFEGKDLKGKSTGTTNADKVNFNELVDYDSRAFPSPRPEFLKIWIKQPGSSARAVLKDNTIRGYGVIRPCIKGYKIGPLFADNDLVAEDIFLNLADFAEGKEIYLDVPEINEPAINLTKKYNMKYVFETARMYNNGSPQMDVNKIFGVTTFELG